VTHDDWTTGPAGASNTSEAFLTLCVEVERLIRGDAHQLIAGHVHRTAWLVVAQLAHEHGVGPRTELLAAVAALTAERDQLRGEAARKGADADRSWRLLTDSRTATKRLTAALIANAPLLDVPFTDEPGLSPWSRSIKPAIDQLRIALGMRGAMRLPCCDLHNRNCEPPSELCCERCTEVDHPVHAGGSVCIAPDLSSPPLADPHDHDKAEAERDRAIKVVEAAEAHVDRIADARTRARERNQP
jgi:hypothetical protein